MRNFLKIAGGIDVGPLNIALVRKRELWNAYEVRKAHAESVHRVVDDIVLRYNRYDSARDDFVDAVCSRVEVVNYPPWQEFPEAQELLFALMGRVKGLHLGRAFIARMAPGVSIPPHSDRIDPAEAAFPDRIPPAVYYDRYHIVLASAAGCQFACGDEIIHMATGEVWWFDNEMIHEVANGSAEDRVHLIADIHSAKGIWRPPA